MLDPQLNCANIQLYVFLCVYVCVCIQKYHWRNLIANKTKEREREKY